MKGIILTYVILLFIAIITLVYGYDLNADLARGLVYNASDGAVTATKFSFGIGMGSSDHPEDCVGVYLNQKKSNGNVSTGIYEIWPREGKPFRVLCDMDTDGGGWTVFQKRGDYASHEDFYRTWLEYKRGFGNLREQFWLGNDRLSMLTNQDVYELRVDLEDFDEEKRFAHYNHIRVANELDKYRLSLGSYRKGDAGDSLGAHNGMKFSTKDEDNDAGPTSCAQRFNGAWWYHNCLDSNLNGGYLRGNHPNAVDQGVNWLKFRDHYYSLKTTEMKIRPIWFKP